jgi:hypothetical protein
MSAILSFQGYEADKQAIELLAETMGNDIRQILNYLQMWFKINKTLKYMDLKQKYLL